MMSLSYFKGIGIGKFAFREQKKRTKRKNQTMKTPVRVNEWKSYATKRAGMRASKIKQFVAVAMETFVPLNGLVKELRAKPFHSFH